MDRPVRARHEEDRARRTPRPAADAVRIGQHGDRPTGGIDLLQFAAGEERDRAAVGRPERKGRALGVGERRDPAIERSHPQRAPAFGPCGKCEPLPVGRHHRPVGPVEPNASGSVISNRARGCERSVLDRKSSSAITVATARSARGERVRPGAGRDDGGISAGERFSIARPRYAAGRARCPARIATAFGGLREAGANQVLEPRRHRHTRRRPGGRVGLR